MHLFFMQIPFPHYNKQGWVQHALKTLSKDNVQMTTNSPFGLGSSNHYWKTCNHTTHHTTHFSVVSNKTTIVVLWFPWWFNLVVGHAWQRTLDSRSTQSILMVT
jgi:hypothetical protein